MGERVHLMSKDVGMETAVSDVLNLIKYAELDEFVLVGHSFAGKVAAAVSDKIHDRVKRVIYLDTFRPDKVRTPQASFDPAKEFPALTPDKLGVLLTEATIDSIGRDVVGAKRRWFMSLATPWPIRLAKDPITLSENYDRVKESYVFCTLSGEPVDDIIAGKWGKLEGPYKKIETGHWPMITNPRETAEDLVALS
jgi:pimeloyl-ACP methyl ester carboxylesterase